MKKTLVILSALIIGGGLFFLSNTKKSSEQPVVNSPEKSTTVIKTVRVEEANLTISYPRDFNFSKELQMNLTTNKPYAVNFSIQNYKNTINETKTPYQLYSNYQWDTDTLSEENFKKSDFMFNPESRKEFLVDGKPAISGISGEQRARYVTYVLVNGHLLMLAASETSSEQREITESIIKSIKFD